MSKVEMIDGNASAEVFCSQLMEVSDDIENIACVVRFKNNTTQVFHTVMNGADLTWLRWVFDKDCVPGGGEDE